MADYRQLYSTVNCPDSWAVADRLLSTALDCGPLPVGGFNPEPMAPEAIVGLE